MTTDIQIDYLTSAAHVYAWGNYRGQSNRMVKCWPLMYCMVKILTPKIMTKASFFQDVTIVLHGACRGKWRLVISLHQVCKNSSHTIRRCIRRCITCQDFILVRIKMGKNTIWCEGCLGCGKHFWVTRSMEHPSVTIGSVEPIGRHIGKNLHPRQHSSSTAHQVHARVVPGQLLKPGIGHGSKVPEPSDWGWIKETTGYQPL